MIEIPDATDSLFSLTALPDGSHNFQEDSVYFNLPSLTNPNKSVYGVSCYRQIPVEVRVALNAASFSLDIHFF